MTSDGSEPASLQPGIAFAPGMRPLPCYRLVFVNATPGARPGDVSDALGRIASMLEALTRGHLRELDGQPSTAVANSARQFDSLRVLLAYGRPAFEPDHPLSDAARPPFLTKLAHPLPAFPALPWHPHTQANFGEADLAVQLTADNPAAVNCAAVEIWKLIDDEGLPLVLAASFDGFGRQDGRGWLEFHDGVSNLETEQREAALVAGDDPPWMAGGTYMAFLRLRVDLTAWRQRSRTEQELVIGRDKLTGAGLVAVKLDDDQPRPRLADPAPEPDSAQWRDPPQTTSQLLEAAHIHRANQTRASAFAPGALRMFRQGYDYIEHLGCKGPVVGLNFVSFQRDLSVLHEVLHLPGWLGDSNFGGPAEDGPQLSPLITLAAGGLYAVPPTERPFPGAHMFSV